MEVADPKPRSIESPAYYRRLLRGVFAGQRFLVVGGHLAGEAALARELSALGATPPLLLGAEVGPARPPADLDWRLIDVRGTGVMESWWDYERKLAAPAREVQAAVDRWDPERRARAVGYIVLSDLPRAADRPRYAARPAAWLELEDKTRLHTLLDAAGVQRGPVGVVRAEPAALRAAHASLDRGAGTVWAGDTRSGVHGGGELVRWIRSPATREAAEAFFCGRCARVRVMPFVEGVPCSIHGIVFEDGVAVFRPVELLVLRRPDGRLAYAGTATYWDPDPADRASLRSLARRLGETLRQRVGFRGAFTLDGVLGADGFVVTELNPRIGAGLFDLARAVPGLPLGPLALAAQAGESLDYRPAELEAFVVERADAARGGHARLALPGTRAREARCPVADRGGTYRAAREGEPVAGSLAVTPTRAGSLVQLRPDPLRTPVGPSFAPRAAQALALADARFTLGIGPLEPPRDVRRPPERRAEGSAGARRSFPSALRGL